MLTTERHLLILQILDAQDTVTIHELLATLGISESTLRRDLQTLEDQGALIRVHGGAQRKDPLTYEASLKEKTQKYHDEKRAIAQFAARFIQPNEIIYLDAGSTTLEMINYLPKEANLKIVTNAISHGVHLTELGFEAIILGGTIKSSTLAIIGATALQQVQKMYFDRVFLGTNGIDLQAGFTTPDSEEAYLKQMAATQGTHTYVLADYSKFNRRSFTQFLSLDQAQIITNTCPKELLKPIEKQTKIMEVTK